jgi:hypothetical protein
VNDDQARIAALHLAALAALQEVARALGPDSDPAAVPERLAAAAAAEDPDPRTLEFARTYVFAARVGGAAADHERAQRWFDGWLSARGRTSAEALAAIVDGIRFAQRLHRALGIDGEPAG